MSTDSAASGPAEDADPGMDWPTLQKTPVFDGDGNEVPFGTIFAEKKSIEYVDDLAKIPPEHLKDVQLVVIGCAPYKFINGFRTETGYQGALYCDPERNIYKNLGLLQNMGSMSGSSKHVKSGTFSGILKSTWRGLKSMQMQGNVTQQGGAFVLGPGENVDFVHRDGGPMDHADINTVLVAAGLEELALFK